MKERMSPFYRKPGWLKTSNQPSLKKPLARCWCRPRNQRAGRGPALASGVDVPPHYDPLLGTITVWAPDRATCVSRMRRALEDFNLVGTHTNIPLLMRVLRSPAFVAGEYATDLLRHLPENDSPDYERVRRDLAVAAAVLYARRREAVNPQTPEQWVTGWHRASRNLG